MTTSITQAPISGIRYISCPLSMFNGDILLLAEKKEGGLYVMLGDFTGHGLPAAVGILPTADTFYDMTKKGAKMEDILSRINMKLSHALPLGFFCSAIFADFNADRSKVRFWNGGIPDGLIYDGKGHIKSNLVSKNLPLGILKNIKHEWEFQEEALDKNDVIYLFSDGIIEVENQQDEIYGETRFAQLFLKRKEKTKDLLEEIDKEIHDFMYQQKDDMTLVEIKPKSRP